MSVLLNSSNFNGTNGSHFELRLEYDLSQSQENNTSTITYYLKMKSKDGYSGSGATARGYINSNQVGTFSSIGVNKTITIGTRTETITHENDGTKTISYSALIDTSWDLGDASVIGNWTLPKISRYPTLISGQDFTDEDNPTLTFTNEGLFPVRVKLEAGGNPQLIIRDIPQNATSYTFDLTNEERNTLRALCPNSNTLNVIETVCAMNGNTELSADYKRYKMTIINGNPVFNNYNFEDVNSTTLALTGSTLNNVINVNGYSNIKATITTSNKAEALKEASMIKYRFAIGDSSTDITYSDEDDVSGVVNSASNGTYNLYAIDSRNNSTLVVKQATSVINYDKVYLDKQNCSIVRDDGGVGDNAILTINGTFWNDNFGVVSNSIKSVSYRLKKSDSSTWIDGTTTITPTTSGNNFSFTGYIASDNQDTTWDLDSSYNLEVIVSDELSSASVELILNSAVPTMSLDKNGVGIMCAYDSDIGGLLQVGGKIIDGGVSLFKTTGSGTTSGNINLDDTITNYDVVEIYGYTSDNIAVYSKIPKTLFNKKIGLMSTATDGTMYIKLCNISIDTTNNQLTINYNREWYKPYNNSSGGYNSSGNYIYITNVIGYKTGLFE